MEKELYTYQRQLETGMNEYFAQYPMEEGKIFVLGCSTSEILGERIGKHSTLAVGQVVVETLKSILTERGLNLAVQGCEHINRALVVEKAVAEKFDFEIVTVIPSLQAGGAATAAAYHSFEKPVIVEKVVSNGGIDIGDTFIGMHVKHVQIPVRTSVKEIGKAHTTYLASRPKLIGGPRAVYN
ncbi:TIGR01440 family protein [Enterococcus sp. BWB1-3]|uniref:TIGR01440 family protein n=1 Tax=unclassified Enterococcus TaxID=2608891 RepID=UPI001923B4BF|nr:MULTISPECIES: TIGR01440 family protein [unclassified Enterococcus]MBL1228587.1 TIGR01440 family protein [Enterococcus sp. BWB1-3]MCB5950593.1 TIGR01440 family protein [Enterococcus sp. BWT-B8]MCB5955917.1 TIGR01440 family protein [Enterococcus sp. CWB-B31]